MENKLNSLEGIDSHNDRAEEFVDSCDLEPALKEMFMRAMRLSPVDIAIRKHQLVLRRGGKS